MDNINIMLAANIQKYRKMNGFTQEELAENLGVTAQSVSKWENAKSLPELLCLVAMADLFDCTLDEMFCRETKIVCCRDDALNLPWQDDDVLRGVVFQGRKVLQATDSGIEKFTFEVIGDALNVQSECNVSVSGSVSGDCCAGGTVNVGYHISGNCNSGGGVTVGGHISGGCTCGMDVTCSGNISGNITSQTITAGGDVEADTITGNVICNSIKFNMLEGSVTIGKTN